jgi:hypothetical protein
MHKDNFLIPESMQAELAEWNNGKGIDLESWVGCSGNFRLAVGYTTIFWPEFVEFEGYILRKGFSVESLRGFESQNGTTPKTVEWVMNHIHIDGIQYASCEDISKDKILLLGNALKEIYQAKLNWLFPEKPCTVEFYVPEQEDNLEDYQISFWQTKHEQ